MSSSVTSRPRSANSSSAAARMRCRLRSASLRSCRGSPVTRSIVHEPEVISPVCARVQHNRRQVLHFHPRPDHHLMRAAIFEGPHSITVGERPDAHIVEPTDAVVRVVLACVCGSDLWYFRGDSPFEPGPIGHEFIGVVEDIGADVATVKKGDFVIAPFAYSDGTCPHCRHGIHTACLNGGFFPMNGDGGQGEALRVPVADGTLVTVPGSGHSDDTLASLLALSDVMATGHHAAACAEVKEGDTVAVVGDGAVGLSAVLAAKRLGAERIIALSRHADRQELAKAFGATEIVAERGEEATERVMELTDGVGVDAALECVGTGLAMDT